MKDTIKRGIYKRVVALVSDLHVGSRFAICGPVWLDKEGGNIGAARNEGQKRIYEHWKFYLRMCNKWNVDTVLLLGDLISGTNFYERGIQQMTTDLDEQKRHAIDLLVPLCKNRKVFAVSGSTYHESTDTRVHYDIAEALGGTFLGSIANLKLKGTNRTLNVAHGASGAWVYRTMIMSRDALHLLEAMQLGKVPKVDMIIRGHWHQFIHIHREKIHILQIPGWQAFVPWRGALRSYGKFQPDIGGVILFVDKEDRMIVLPFTMKDIPHIGDPLWEA